VAGCLEKTAAVSYRAALPRCVEAARLAPDNSEVQAALAKVRAATGMSVPGAAELGAGKAAAEGAGAPPVSSGPTGALEGAGQESQDAQESLTDKASGLLK
jgi:hypothetical protein